jgi:nucleoid DNA-binding protein/cell division septation protein DedD
VEITKYILDLICENECVIVPGFGAFVSSYKPAQVDNTEETILPPSKEITFDTKLKTNDWLLANYISAGEGISRFDALKKIEEFNENAQYRLEKGETVEFEGLGVLRFDDKSNPVFTMLSDKNFLLDSFGLSKVSLKKPEQPQPEEIKESIVEEETEKNKKVWLFFLLIPVAAVVVFIYLNYFSPKTHTPVPAPKNIILPTDTPSASVTPANADTLQNNAANDSLANPQIKPETKEAEQNPTGKYYLIGGSFKEQENVDKFMRKVENAGFKPINLGRQGNFFIVAIGVYQTFEEADSAMNSYSKIDPASGVWIKKIK